MSAVPVKMVRGFVYLELKHHVKTGNDAYLEIKGEMEATGVNKSAEYRSF